MTQPRTNRVAARDPYRTHHSSNSGRRIPHWDKVPQDEPDKSSILITLHQFELAGIEVDDRAVEIATKLTKWRQANRESEMAEHAEEMEQRRKADAERECWVYYVRIGRLVKIGMTTNLNARFASLRPNEVLAIEPGGLEDEAALHQRFAELRAGGEYFHPGAALQEHIKELRGSLGAPDWTRSTVPDGQDWFAS